MSTRMPCVDSLRRQPDIHCCAQAAEGACARSATQAAEETQQAAEEAQAVEEA